MPKKFIFGVWPSFPLYFVVILCPYNPLKLKLSKNNVIPRSAGGGRWKLAGPNPDISGKILDFLFFQFPSWTEPYVLGRPNGNIFSRRGRYFRENKIPEKSISGRETFSRPADGRATLAYASAVKNMTWFPQVPKKITSTDMGNISYINHFPCRIY